jgi:hypothetical protein
MNPKSLAMTAALLVATISCGSLSNDDLLFAAALPGKELKLDPPAAPGTQAQALNGGLTVQTQIAKMAAAKMNLFIQSVVDHVDAIGKEQPSVRALNHREWGPFLVASTGLFAHLNMERVSDVLCEVTSAALDQNAPGYRWTIEVSRNKGGKFGGLISGESRGYNFDHSCGSVHINIAAARGFGVHFNDPALASVSGFHETWDRNGVEALFTAQIDAPVMGKNALVEGLQYRFERHADSSGAFSFALRGDVRGVGEEFIRAALQWRPAAAPWRSDFCLRPQMSRQDDCGSACGPHPGQRTYFTDTAGITGSSGNEANACGGLLHQEPPLSAN